MHAQDEAAALAIGIHPRPFAPERALDPAYWMRLYFRHARSIERALDRQMEFAGQRTTPPRNALRLKAPARAGFYVDDGLLLLKQPRPDLDPAADPEIVLAAFALVAEAGVRLAPESEERIAAAIPHLSSALEAVAGRVGRLELFGGA